MNTYLFKLYGECYIYSVFTNAIVKITEKLYEYLAGNISDESLTEIDCSGLTYLRREGIISDKDNQFVISHSETDILEDMYRNNLKSMILQLTQNCNLRCKYCVYSGSYTNRTHNNKRMNWDTAKRALDFLLEHSSASPKIAIGFYGGEPLLEFELIQKCVAYAETIFVGKELHFNMTTNATLLSDEMIYFFQEHGFNITISLDGPKEVQDSNRVLADNETGSFNTVIEKIKMIDRVAPDFYNNVSFNAVVDLQNNVSDINDFFLSYDIIKNIFVSGNFVNPNGRKDKAKFDRECYIASKYENFKTYLFYCTEIFSSYKPKLMNNLMDRLKKELYERTVIMPKDEVNIAASGQCLPGLQRFFVSVDGNFFPCERVNENSCEYCIGNLEKGFDIVSAKRMLNVAHITEQECARCWNIRLCGQCVAMAEDNGEISRSMRLKKCDEMKKTSSEHIKDYIVLKKYGCNFEKRDIYENK